MSTPPVTAISKYHEAQCLQIGSSKNRISVKQALACLDSNFFIKTLHIVICFFQGKGLVNKKCIVKLLNETDLATLNKVNYLFAKAKKLAEHHKDNTTEANQKKDALKFLQSKEKSSQTFLSRIQDAYLFKFSQEEELLTFCQNLPTEKKQSVITLAQKGITAEYLIKKYGITVEDLSSRMKDKDHFFKEINEGLEKIYSPQELSIKNFVEELNEGLLPSFVPKSTRADPKKIKSVTISDTELQVTFLTNEDPQMLTIKNKIFDGITHLICLGYPPELLLTPYSPNTNESVHMIDAIFVSQNIIKKTFLIKNNTNKASPIEKKITLLAFLNWPESGTPNFEEFQAFIKMERELEQKTPLIIATRNLAQVGIYALANYSKADDKHAHTIHRHIEKISKKLGTAAAPKTAEEIGFVYALLKNDSLSFEEASLLKNSSKAQTFKELAQALFKFFNPEGEATQEQLKEIKSTLKTLGIKKNNFQKDCSESLAILAHIYKEQIFLNELEAHLHTQAMDLGWTLSDDFDDSRFLSIPEIRKAAFEKLYEKHANVLKELEKKIFFDIKDKAALAVQKALLQKNLTHTAFANEILSSPSAQQSLLKLLFHNISYVELLQLFEKFQSKLVVEAAIVEPELFVDLDTNRNLDLWAIFTRPSRFSEILRTLITLRDES
ncbi:MULTISPECIES: hypothetical protein [Parachlamydia]|jgi:hypothetical protein|uniref:hypothetical protein n=1 Tax=Parachlamydia TaxID=83551 RepID=UPI0007508AB7|nr:hypothetical protein [Parachlamydia acanthamoebae]